MAVSSAKFSLLQLLRQIRLENLTVLPAETLGKAIRRWDIPGR